MIFRNLSRFLIAVIDSFYAGGNRRQYFIGNSIYPFGQLGDRQICSEDFHLVTLFAVDIGDIDHTYIHTYIAYIGGFFPIYHAIAVTIAEFSIQPIGIAYGQGCYARRTCQHPFTAVPHRFVGIDVVYLQNYCLQRGYWVQCGIICYGRYAIQTYSKTHHVVLNIQKAFGTGAVAYMS